MKDRGYSLASPPVRGHHAAQKRLREWAEGIARFESNLSVWRIHTPSAQSILDAAQIQERYNLSFWDAMIVVSASQLGCTVIWSEDPDV